MQKGKMRTSRRLAVFLILAAALRPGTSSATPQAQPASPPASRVVDLTAPDGTLLKATYFAAAKLGPGVLLLHQVNRQRKTWDGVAAQLAAAGIHTLTLDMRGFGESGGTPFEKLPPAEQRKRWQGWPEDVEVAFQFLTSQPGVQRDVIGLAGAGLLGVDNAVKIAHHHPSQVKSLALLSGETFLPELRFLREAGQLPGLFVVSDDDEYPPTVEAMELLYTNSPNSGKKFVHYSASHEAPWLWYEPFDIGKVPANGSHGTDLFQKHPELPGIIVDWFVTTLIQTPGHAPADSIASAAILKQIEMHGGVAEVTRQLQEARQKDPAAQLFPEITVDIIGADHLRVGEAQAALEVFQLLVLAYPDSADARTDLADAYLALGQKDLARQHAEKALALLDSQATPASSWSDTEQRRGEIRKSVLHTLKQLNTEQN